MSMMTLIKASNHNARFAIAWIYEKILSTCTHHDCSPTLNPNTFSIFSIKLSLLFCHSETTICSGSIRSELGVPICPS